MGNLDSKMSSFKYMWEQVYETMKAQDKVKPRWMNFQMELYQGLAKKIDNLTSK